MSTRPIASSAIPEEFISGEPALAEGFLDPKEVRPIDIKRRVVVKANTQDLNGMVTNGRSLEELAASGPSLNDLPADFLTRVAEIKLTEVIVPPGTKLYAKKDLKDVLVTLNRDLVPGHNETCRATQFFRNIGRLGQMILHCERDGRSWTGDIDSGTPVLSGKVRVSFGRYDKPATKTVIIDVQNPSSTLSGMTYNGVHYAPDTAELMKKLIKENGEVKSVEFFDAVLPKGTPLYSQHPDLPQGYLKITHRIGE